MPSRPPGLSVRLRLTLSYALFVVIVGIAVFALGFLLLRFVPDGNLLADTGAVAPRRVDLLDVFIRYAWWTIAGLAVVGSVGGWIVSGLMLRPLTHITDAARRARDGSFDHRIALPGRRSELTELADTFDAMLARVSTTIDEQQRFAANASHELRTPLATTRTMLEVARADPAGVDAPRLLQRLEHTNERAIRMTEALLALSRASGRRTVARTRVEVSTLTAGLLADLADEAASAGVKVRMDAASPAVASGDETLLRQAIGNVVRNAVVHNIPGGWLRVSVGADERDVIVDVENTGAVLSATLVATLPEPFVRAAGRTHRGADGVGLGLAIVVSIARAHDGRLELWPRPDGGLHARLRLPRS